MKNPDESWVIHEQQTKVNHEQNSKYDSNCWIYQNNKDRLLKIDDKAVLSIDNVKNINPIK